MKTLTDSSSIKRIFVAAGFATAISASAWADGAVDPDFAAHAAWSAFMVQHPAPAAGCFHASYPHVVWERVDCKIDKPRVHPTHITPADDKPPGTGGLH